MKKLQPFLFTLALVLGITAAFAGLRITPYVYVDGGGYYKRIPGPSYYSLGKCIANTGTYCFYGATDGNLPLVLTQAQVDYYVSIGRLSAHYPDKKYEFRIQ